MNKNKSLELRAPWWRRLSNVPGDLWESLAKRARRMRSESRIFVYLSIIGPGLVAANAGNDAGGIATYATVGARYGYQLLWMMVLITISLSIVQEMCARMGAVTGKGLSDLIREQFGVRWTAVIMLCLLVANTGTTISEFIGIAVSLELLNIPRYISVPVVAAILWWLIVKGSYQHAERVFLLMSTIFLGYIISAFLARPDWHAVLNGMVRPKFYFERDYIMLFIGTVGTTITPYMQIYIQSSVVEKGITTEHYSIERVDTYFGAIFSNIIAVFIIISTAATLYIHKIPIETAADAARALGPLAGQYAQILFAVGLFGASMLAAAILPLSTAYSLSEAFGFEKGISYSFREAPIFLGIFTGLILIGTVVAMIPNLPMLRVLLIVQVMNGMILPIVLIAIMLLVNNRELMGDMVNSRWQNLLGWITVAFVGLLSVTYVVMEIVF